MVRVWKTSLVRFLTLYQERAFRENILQQRACPLPNNVGYKILEAVRGASRSINPTNPVPLK